MHFIWMLKSFDMNFFVQLSPNAARKSFSSAYRYSGLLNSSGVHFLSERPLFSLFPTLNNINCSSSTYLSFATGACGGFIVVPHDVLWPSAGLIDLFKLVVPDTVDLGAAV